MAAPDELVTFVVPVERVRESLTTLLDQKVHPFFVAYLHLRRMAGRQHRLTGLEPHWAELGERLEVPGGPAGKPYLRPFWNQTRGANQEWLNGNLAGSFAPSSLRGVPMEVVETDAKRRFTLRPKHWLLAREHLLAGETVPALAVAAYFFRDYGFRAEAPPTAEDLIALFRADYSYAPDDSAEFETLFDATWRGAAGAWTEPLGGTE
jgi:hypothetical protein